MSRPTMHSRVDQLWNEQKKKLQFQFSKLTDQDLYFETGRKYEMIERIRIKLGKTDDEINEIFDAL